MKHLDAENVRVLILSAGKIDNELEKIFGKIPSGLIPINGKPVIFRIIDKLLDEGKIISKLIGIDVDYSLVSTYRAINLLKFSTGNLKNSH